MSKRAKRDAADLAEHRRIKPRAHEPRPPAPNDAHRRLQLAPSDPRWEMTPPYGWKTHKPGESFANGLTFAKCWYCAQSVDLSETTLYSKMLSCVAHDECVGDDDAPGDTIAPKRATVDST